MKYFIVTFFLLLSINLNAQWEIVSGTEYLNINRIQTDQNIMYLGTGGYGLWKSTTASAPWDKYDYSNGLEAVNVRAVLLNGQNIFAASEKGVYKSSDNGVSWTLINDPIPYPETHDLIAVGGKIIKACANGLSVSEDGGSNWTLNPNVLGPIFGLGASDGFVYAGGGPTYISGDGGSTWIKHVWDDSGYGLSSAWKFTHTEGITFASVSQKGVYADPGAGDWTPRNTGIESLNSVDIDSQDSTIVVAARLDGIFLSEDLGFTWTNISGGIPNVFANCVNIFGGYIYAGVGTSGVHGLYRMPLPGTPVALEREDELPASYALNQNYPNPFNPSTKISFELPEQSNVKLEIYDVLGRKVATLVDKLLSAGYYNRSWDASSFPSGTYFYKLETNNFTYTKKMLVLK